MEARAHVDEIVGQVNGPLLLASLSLLAAFAHSFRSLNAVFNENPGLPYVISRGLSLGNRGQPTSDELARLLRELGKLFLWEQRAETYAALSKSPESENEGAARLAIVHRRIEAVNPDIYVNQLLELVEGAYVPLDGFFVERLGFSASGGFAVALGILKAMVGVLARSRPSLEVSLRAADRVACPADELVNAAPNALEPVLTAAKSLFLDGRPPDGQSERFLARLAQPVGSAYAGNAPLIFRLLDGRLLVPDPKRLVFGVRTVLDDALDNERRSQSPVWQRFQRARSRFLEERVARFLRRVFPAECVTPQCHYELDGQRHEVDLLVHFDGWLLVVEAKAGDVGAAARRGARKSLERDLKKLLGEAHSQGRNVIRYASGPFPIDFRDAHGRVVLSLNERPRHVRVINVTLEHLMTFGVRQKLLQEFGLFGEEDFLWTVNLFDLDIITSHVGSPGLFLYFVDRRIASQAEELFHAFDELTIFGYFCSVGTLAPPLTREGGRVGAVYLAGDFLRKFDRYHLHSGKAPEVKLESAVRQLIQDLMDGGKDGWTDAAGMLLDVPRGGQRQLAKNVVATLKRCRKKGRMSDFSLDSGEGVSLTYLVVAEASDSRDFLQMWCSRKASETGRGVWLGLLKILGEPGRYVSDWVVIRRPEDDKAAAVPV